MSNLCSMCGKPATLKWNNKGWFCDACHILQLKIMEVEEKLEPPYRRRKK